MTTRTARRILLGLGIVAAAVVVAVIIAIAANPNNAPAPDQPAMNQYGAEVACEGFVKDRVGPATFTGEQVMGTSPSFIIQGVASLSGQQRTWTCIVAPNGTNWDLVSLDGLG